VVSQQYFLSLDVPSRTLRSLSLSRSLTVFHRPEPVRISPSALQYSVSEISVEEGVHPEELVDALGFEYVVLPSHLEHLDERYLTIML
jgi:hypothetical protein